MRAWFDWLHMASFHESLDKKWAPWEHSAGQTFDAHHWDKNEQDWAGKDTQRLIDMDLEWSVRSWPWHLWRSSFQPPPARPKMTKKREANFIKAYSCLCQEVYKRFLRFILLSCTMNTFEYEIRSSWVSCIFFGGEPLEPTCFRFAQGTVGSQPRLLPSRCPAKHRATRGVPEHCQAWYSEKGSEKQWRNQKK